jgi:hypothetical protein
VICITRVEAAVCYVTDVGGNGGSRGTIITQVTVLNLLLTISQGNALTAVQFLMLNVATILLLCSSYAAFLFFLHKKRIRSGAYDAAAPLA